MLHVSFHNLLNVAGLSGAIDGRPYASETLTGLSNLADVQSAEASVGASVALLVSDESVAVYVALGINPAADADPRILVDPGKPLSVYVPGGFKVAARLSQ